MITIRKRHMFLLPAVLVCALGSAASAYGSPGTGGSDGAHNPAGSKISSSGAKTAVTTTDQTTEADLGKAIVENQPIVDAVAASIESLPDASKSIGGIEVDVKEKKVSVWWVGDVPQSLKAIIKANVNDVPIEVNPALHSRAELDSLAAKVVQDSIAGRGPKVTSASAESDGSGIAVHLERDPQSLNVDAIKSAVDRISSKYGPEIAVEADMGRQPLPQVRQNGADPWEGGMLMRSTDQNCSNSWGINATYPTTGKRTLSAGHCQPKAFSTWKDNDGDSFVTSAPKINVQTDSMLLDPVGEPAARIYGGPYNATSTASRFLLEPKGSEGSSKGDYVCTGGANSGEHCVPSIKITEVNDHVVVNGTTVTMHYGVNDNTNAISVAGDSGGPVYRRGSGLAIYARGVIYGGSSDGLASCPATAVNPFNNCTTDVYFVPISTILTTWQATLMTY